MKYLIGVVALTTLSGCATLNETWDDAMYRITSAECKLFKAEQYGKALGANPSDSNKCDV